MSFFTITGSEEKSKKKCSTKQVQDKQRDQDRVLQRPRSFFSGSQRGILKSSTNAYYNSSPVKTSKKSSAGAFRLLDSGDAKGIKNDSFSFFGSLSQRRRKITKSIKDKLTNSAEKENRLEIGHYEKIRQSAIEDSINNKLFENSLDNYESLNECNGNSESNQEYEEGCYQEYSEGTLGSYSGASKDQAKEVRQNSIPENINRPLETEPTSDQPENSEEERQMKEALQNISVMKKEKQRAQEIKEKFKAAKDRKKKQEEAKLTLKQQDEADKKAQKDLQDKRDKLIYGRTGKATSSMTFPKVEALLNPTLESLGKGKSSSQEGNSKAEEGTKMNNYNSEQPENPKVVNKIISTQGFEKKMTKVMFKKSVSPDEFLKKITSTQIFKYGQQENLDEFSILPESFKDYQDYHKNWMPLFEYESYCQLTNLRKEGSKCKVASYGWLAKLTFTHADKFITFRMDKPINDQYHFDARNHQCFIKSEPDGNRGDQITGRCRLHWEQIADSLRENDLVLFSKYKLTGVYDLFDTSTDEKGRRLLQTVLPKYGTFLAMVVRRRKLKETFVTMKTDRLYKEDLVKIICPEKNSMPLFYCYFLTSLSTILREYKALHALEHSSYLKMVLDPARVLSEREIMKEESDQNNKEMELFLHKNGEYFNGSQLAALKEVASMRKRDVLLIQGPPGTGKTQTVHGILSMILGKKKECENKILVCAPSNAAVDEIVLRCVNKGLISHSGKKRKCSIVRIGVLDYNPPEKVRQYSLDELVKLKMKQSSYKVTAQMEDKLKSKISTLGACITRFEKGQRLDTPYEDFKKQEKECMKRLYKIMSASMKEEFEQTNLYQRRLQILANMKLKSEQDMKELKNKNSSETSRRINSEKEILTEVKIICTTLSMSGIDKIEKMDFCFSHLIIDEACQCTEISALIPLIHRPEKIIFVGDQNQLPATCFAPNALTTGFNKSLYERLLNQGAKQIMLSVQYRMHPEIRSFPSDQFYDSRITDGENVILRKTGRMGKFANRLMFYDLCYSQEGGLLSDTSESMSKSKSNRDEADFIVKLIAEVILILGRESPNSGIDKIIDKIGIITPYKKQSWIIKDALRADLHKILKLGEHEVNSEKIIEVNTVDSFQGREKEIIIISCVRSTGGNGTIGFLNDFRRMNVAITRAKSYLWIVGNAETLKMNHNWKALVEHCQDKGRFKGYMSKSEVQRDEKILSKSPEQYAKERKEELKRISELAPTQSLPSSDQIPLPKPKDGSECGSKRSKSPSQDEKEESADKSSPHPQKKRDIKHASKQE
ncbi:unnamed protein product [Moneuplotes crassus]|uniref:Uncharacterized protein n=1 Tax=Euplotes crassus TaxID=5936 RepID=A0AAD1X9D3_EUPCR|nr:unnamed protein product [Moneuplotes crassus]